MGVYSNNKKGLMDRRHELREEAGKAGVHTRGSQDIVWAGLKKKKTEAAGKTFEYEGPMINHINRSLITTGWLAGRVTRSCGVA